MSVQNDHRISRSQSETLDDTHAWTDQASDFVLVAEGKPPSRIELARERMLICRLYLGLMRTITDDYGAEFAADSDSAPRRSSGSNSIELTTMHARLGSRRSAKIERRGSVLPRVSARTASESPDAWLRSKPSVSAHPLTQVAGLRNGSGNASTQTSRLSRRCTTANFLRAVLLGRELLNSPG